MQAQQAIRCNAGTHCRRPPRPRVFLNCNQCGSTVHQECLEERPNPDDVRGRLLRFCLKCVHDGVIERMEIEETEANPAEQQNNHDRRFAPPEDADMWTMPYKASYIKYLVDLMNYFDDPIIPYTKTTTFTRSKLLELNPTIIKKWLSTMAYGKEEYDANHDAPKHARSSTLEQSKKCVSYFMPHKNVKWIDGKGNPTMHPSVHKVIQDVKKAEARRLGKRSQTKRPLKTAEFRKTFEIFRAQKNWAHQVLYPTMCLWQYTLIARNDDICHFKASDPKGHPRYPFALSTTVRWSKNIHEERQCPDQIILGSRDPNFCMLIQLSIYLESYLEQFPEAEYLFTEDSSNNTVDRLKNRFRTALGKVVWDSDEFKAVMDELDRDEGVGTHSQRKYPATHAANMGCTPAEIEIRGRWKKKNG